MEQEYITVKELAQAAGVSTQYIYKLLPNKLKAYTKKKNKKTVVNAVAIEYIKNGFPAKQPTKQSATNQIQPAEKEIMQPMQPTLQPTNATRTNNNDNTTNGEIEALKSLIEELKQDKEDLKQDKLDLKKEVEKWQTLFIDERNKVKLLEAAKEQDAEDENVIYNVIDADDSAAKKKNFFEKLADIFKS